MVKSYKTKDSGKREDYQSGMKRDTEEGKPAFSLILPLLQPFKETLLYRWAMLMMRGFKKYGYRNWEKANSEEELERYKSSAMRHFMQWMACEDDEDHSAAVCFNINAAEYVKWRLKNG